MPRDICSAQQPEHTVDLIRALQNEQTGEQETSALNAIKSEMVWLFKDKPRLLYWNEAMLLSEVATHDEFKDLIYGFTVAIGDGKSVAPDLLRYFAGCLRWRQRDISRDELRFEPLLEGLSEHLNKVNEATELRTSYLLTQAIGTLLDAMVDVKVEGIDRVAVHEPLTKKLRALKSHQEPRMAQAAEYALQALHHIPDNEGPWEEVLRWTGVTIDVVAKISSGVAKCDPQQIIEAGPGLLKLVGRFGEALKGGQEVWEAHEGLKQMIAAMRNRSERNKPAERDWYHGLRRIAILIQLRAYEILPVAITGLRCCAQPQFWRGLYSQLEKQWFTNEASRGNIERFIQWTFTQLSLKQLYTKKNSIRIWVWLLADSLQKPGWKDRFPKKEKKICSFLFRDEEVKPQLRGIQESQTNSHGASKLLKSAIKQCTKAKLFYADAIIAQYYTRGNILHVKRLSEDDVPMENCYINLSLIEYQIEANKARNANQFSLQERLKAEAPDTEKEVVLEDLFESRILRNGSLGRPSRILIRGRAGVGKTTLCKKITHTFLYQQLWKSQHDRIIWIPLRILRRYQTYEAFLEQEIFSKVPYGSILWEEFKQSLRSVEDSRTLFLLDGLDELAGDQDKINDFQYLLNQQNVIVTSRPHAVTPHGLNIYDLEIETVGFLDHQVKAYVGKVSHESIRDQILEFITQNWVMKGLMRIPIQLDALCFTWERYRPESPLTTMTALYEAIEIKLWKKDLRRLDPKPGTKDSAKCHFRPQLFEVTPDRFRFIQYIAFFGLYNNVTEFTLNIREKLYQIFPKVTDTVLDESSFLRSSDSPFGYRDHEYYFLHLTSQEYFAAHHFTQNWQTGKDIETLDLQSGTVVSFTPEEFISREKYSGRYNIMWRFITGILTSEENGLVRFLQQIEMKPRDLLGHAHAQLLMYCFNEISESVQSSTVGRIREDMDNQLSQQLLVKSTQDIGKEPELPKRILSKCLEKGNFYQQKGILWEIWSHPQLPLGLSVQIWRLYQSTPSRYVRETAAWIIGRYPTFLSQEAIDVIFTSNKNVFDKVILGLRGHPDPPEDILSAAVVASRLPWGMKAANLLGQQAELPAMIIEYFISKLSHSSSSNNRRRGVAALAKSSLSINSVRRRFVELLDDPDPSVRLECLKALRNHSNLSHPDCDRIFQKLDKISSDAEKEQVYGVLKTQQALPPMILGQMWKVLEDDSAYIRGCAFDILKRHNAFSEDESLDRFCGSLCQDNFAMAVTKGALGHGTFPPQVLFCHCISIVKRSWQAMNRGNGFDESDDPGIPYSAIEALQDCHSLPSDIIHTLWQIHEAYGSVGIIKDVLSAQKALPQEIWGGIASSIERSNDVQRTNWLLMLLGQRSLPDSVIECLVALAVRDPPEKYAIGVLSGLDKIPLRFLDPLVELLLSTDFSTAQNGVIILSKHKILESLLPRLGPEYWAALFRVLLEAYPTPATFCYSQAHYVHVVMPELSWKVSIEQPEQRRKMEFALDSIEQRIQNEVGDAWNALRLRPLDMKRYL